MPGQIRPDENTHKRNCRMFRKSAAARLRADYIHLDDVFDRKTCIRPEGTHSWHDKSFGIMWVGVQGNDTICVVNMKHDVDLSRVLWGSSQLFGCSKDEVLYDFRKLAVSEIEGQRDCKNRVPFGVVSVTQCSNEVVKESGHEASSDDSVEKKALNFLLEKFNSMEPPEEYDKERGKLFLERRDKVASKLKNIIEASSTFAVYDEKKAIEFLQEKMESNENLNVDETIQTTISAFQHLLQKKFKANEIEVSYLDPDFKVTGWGYLFDTADFVDLEIVDIERHLAAINGPRAVPVDLEIVDIESKSCA